MTKTKGAAVDEPEPAAGAVTSPGKPLVALVAVAVASAAVIATVSAYLMPLDEEPVEPPPERVQLPDGLPERPDPNPTIQIPVLPVDIEAEDLRAELLQLAADLQREFPEEPEAMHVIGLLYADLQRTKEAEEVWQKCIQVAPDQAGPYLGLATTSMELGKYQEALEILERAFAAGCSSADLYHETAAALSKLGRLQEAKEKLQEGMERYPGAAENWLQLGQVQIQLGEFARAEESLKRAIDAGTPTDSVYFSLATACARQGKADEAAEYREIFSQRKAAQENRAMDPFQIRYDAELRRIAIAATCRAGAVYHHEGKLDRAESWLRRALDLAPGNPVVCGELVRLYRDQGRIADAMLIQNRLIEIEGNDASHFVNLASFAAQLGDGRLAESALQRVISMRPDLPTGYAGLARLYLQAGNYDQARWFAESALRQTAEPTAETAQTYAVLAEACRQLGDQAAAQAAVEAAAKLGL